MEQVPFAHLCTHKHQLHVHARTFADRRARHRRSREFITVFLKSLAVYNRGQTEAAALGRGGAEHEDASVLRALLCLCGCSAPGKRYVRCPTAFGTKHLLLLCMLAAAGETRSGSSNKNRLFSIENVSFALIVSPPFEWTRSIPIQHPSRP